MELQRAQAFAGDTSVRQPKERIAVTMPLLLQLRSRTQLPKGMHSRHILIHLAKRPSSTLCKRSLQMRPSSECCWRIRHIYFCATSSLAVEVQWNYLPHYKRRAPSRAMLSPGVPAKPRIPPPLPPLMASEASSVGVALVSPLKSMTGRKTCSSRAMVAALASASPTTGVVLCVMRVKMRWSTH